MKEPRKKYASEAALCAEFVALARAHGFRVYAETSGFDLLLVAGPSCAGFKEHDQIGVHAKLSPNVVVLGQALPQAARRVSPHYYVALVPWAHSRFLDVARALRIVTITGDKLHEDFSFSRVRWFRHEPTKLCWVPECEVPGMLAGIPAPQQLTRWKMLAIKLCLLCEERGFLMRRDFDAAGVSMTRWLKQGWLEPRDVESPLRRRGNRVAQSYVLVPERLPPHLKHPEVADVLRKQRAVCGA